LDNGLAGCTFIARETCVAGKQDRTQVMPCAHSEKGMLHVKQCPYNAIILALNSLLHQANEDVGLHGMLAITETTIIFLRHAAPK
jgi:hypothetical protein